MPEAPVHGSKISPRLDFNAIIRYFCNNGYTLVGSTTSRCTVEETWSQPVPQCKGDVSLLLYKQFLYSAKFRLD